MKSGQYTDKLSHETHAREKKIQEIQWATL